MHALVDQLGLIDSILEDGGVGVWVMRVSTGMLTANTVLHRMLGLDLDSAGQELCPERWLEHVHPLDRKSVQQRLLLVQTSRVESECFHYRINKEPTEWRTLQARVRVAERDTDGSPLQLLGVVTDITNEAELRRRMHAVFDRPFQFVGLLTPAGILLETNRSSLDKSGYAAADVIGLPFWEVPFFRHSPALRQQIREGINAAAAGETVRFEMVTHDSSGRYDMTVDFTLTPVRDEHGAVMYIIPEGRDISAVVRTREALQRSEDRLNMAARAANFGIWDWQCSTGEVWYNEQSGAMLGYEPGELPSTLDRFQQLCHPDDLQRVVETRQAFLQGTHPVLRVEYRLRRRDSSWCWVIAKGQAVMRDDQGVVTRVAGVVIDITERQEFESKRAATQRLESMGRLAAGVAHEINTPLQYVSDSLYFVNQGVGQLLDQLCKQPLNESGPQAAKWQSLRDKLPIAMKHASGGLSRIAGIVSSMRALTQLEQVAKTILDTNQCIASALTRVREHYEPVANLETQYGAPPLIMAYADQIDLIVGNLIINAAHAIADVMERTHSKGLITVRTSRDADDVVISIGDTGDGIPESIRHLVFEPFFTTKEIGRGAGQSLALAQQVVTQLHGGSLAFHTQSGEGTTFVMRLPIDPVATAESVS